jgi:hypothetical protein
MRAAFSDWEYAFALDDASCMHALDTTVAVSQLAVVDDEQCDVAQHALASTRPFSPRLLRHAAQESSQPARGSWLLQIDGRPTPHAPLVYAEPGLTTSLGRTLA